MTPAAPTRHRPTQNCRPAAAIGVYSHPRVLRSFALMLTLLCSLTGCEEHVVYSSLSGLRALADGKGHVSAQGGTLSSAALDQHHSTWAVEVKVFAGSNRSSRAGQLIDKLKNAGIDNVWIRENSGLLRVLVGNFDSPQTDDARQTLHHLRTLTGDDGKPLYAEANLTSLTTTGKLIHDPDNLQAYHNDYTLQIGYYIGQDHRQNAEKAVAELRKQHVSAFYYHGPNRSLITVGLFTQQQAFVTRPDPISPPDSPTYIQVYSDQVLKLQKRFPYNLENGITVSEIINGKNAGTRPSFLVRTPG